MNENCGDQGEYGMIQKCSTRIGDVHNNKEVFGDVHNNKEVWQVVKRKNQLQPVGEC